ncbi:MAG: glycine cleavage system protein GcvH [Acidimicrobiales bacterium]
MNVPDDLKYSTDHEWVRVDDAGVATIGITDYAQDALGDVVFIELPEAGVSIETGASFGEVESTKSVSDLFAPITGKVTQVNDQLVDNPEKVNEDPYGEGWICVIEPSDTAEFSALLDASAYSELIEG